MWRTCGEVADASEALVERLPTQVSEKRIGSARLEQCGLPKDEGSHAVSVKPHLSLCVTVHPELQDAGVE